MATQELKTKAEKIKLLALDVDGVLTDGSIVYDSMGIETKAFNVKDGFGISRLIKSGLIVALITGRESNMVNVRASNLGIQHVFQNIKDKTLALHSLLNEHGLELNEIAYMGDDIPDLCVLEKVGLPCCPNDAVAEIKAICPFISTNPGGHGAVRELADLIYTSRKIKATTYTQ